MPSRTSALVLAACVLSAGCEGGGAAAPASDGRSSADRAPARRIAALAPALNEVLFAVGCGARVVLRDPASDYPAAVRRLPTTDPFSLVVEHVASFRPDLVLLNHVDARRARGLQRLGPRVISFDPQSVAAVLEAIVAIGRLCDGRIAAEHLAGRLRQRLAAVAARVRSRRPPSVYVELDGSNPLQPWTVGSRSFIADLVRRAGGQPIFQSVARAAWQVNAEAVLRAAPEVILLNVPLADRSALRRALLLRPGWAEVPALRDGRIVDGIDPSLLSRPSPRLVEGVEALARALHPAAFDARSEAATTR
ncbi:MAG: ABC transporter substrate-binding protein [Proteobacteria bacterium]|nr:ABC transporter substrate-binding protein [Pseudomonadota bacterium]